MNYDLHQVIAGYLDVFVGLSLGVIIFMISRHYDQLNMRRNRLLDIQSKLATAYAGICDARWMCRPQPHQRSAYHQMLITIGQYRGVFVDSKHELTSAALIPDDQLTQANQALKQIDLYLLSLLKESTRFDPETGIPLPADSDTLKLADHPIYQDFISEWSTRASQGLHCQASTELRVPFHQLREVLERAISL